MRIISGKYKSRRLTAPKNLPVRPTTDMAKESLFNILNNWYTIQDITVLDLFSGTGNISFEFSSRGNNQVTAVDQHGGCIYYINQINKELDFNINVIKADVFSFLEKHSGKYDLIFADPPYEFSIDQFAKIPALVWENSLLDESGTLVIEHSQETDLSHLPNFTQSKRYGGCMFSFFEL